MIDLQLLDQNIKEYETGNTPVTTPQSMQSSNWISKYRPIFEDVRTIDTLLPEKSRERFNKVISVSANPDIDRMQIGLSMLMSDKLGIPLDDVYDNYDARSYALFQKDMHIPDQFASIGEIMTGRMDKIQSERKTLEKKQADSIGKEPVGRIEMTPIGAEWVYEDVFSPEEKARLNLVKFLDTGVPLLSKSEKAQEIVKSLKRGSAQLLYGASMPARWLGAKSIAEDVEGYIDEVLEANKVDQQYINTWNKMKGGKYLDFDWWLINGTEQLPFQLAAMAVSAGAGTAFNIGAKAVGLGSKLVRAGTVGTASVAGAMSEGVVEGGRTAHEMKKMGASDEEAAIAGFSVFRRNTALLTMTNGLNIMLGFAPGKVAKILSLATGTATEPIEELWQDNISKSAMVETLPRLIEQITPAQDFLEIFDIRDPEKLDTFMLSLMMGFTEPSTGMFLSAVDNLKSGKGTAADAMKAERNFTNAAVNEYNDLKKRPVLNKYEQGLKELGDEYIKDGSYIENIEEYANKKYRLQRKEAQRKVEELNKRYEEGEIKLSEMSKKELAETAGVDPKTDFNKSELLNIIKKKATKLELGKIKEFKQQAVENDVDVSKMKKKELAVALGLPENTPFSRKELVNIVEAGGETFAPQIARDMLLDFLKKTDEGKVAYKNFEGVSLQDQVDLYEKTKETDNVQGMSLEQAQKYAEDSGNTGTPLNKLTQIGRNFYNENEVISQIIELALNPEFDPSKPQANISTVIEERVHRYFNSRFRWDGENNRFKDEWFNKLIRDTREAAEARDITSPLNDAEWIAEVGVDFALSENPDQYIKNKGFSAKFKEVLDSIREYIQAILKNAGIFRKLHSEGLIKEDLLKLIKDSVTGEIQTANVQDYISKNPKVKQAADKLNNINSELGGENAVQISETAQVSLQSETESGEEIRGAQQENRENKEKELKNFLENPKGNFELPGINPDILKQLGKTEKPIILKENIVEKNKNNHSEIDLDSSIEILNSALYNPTEIIQSLPKKKPNYYSFVEFINKGKQVQIELSETKDSFEIIGWHYSDDKSIKRQEKRAEREGGEILIIPDNQVVGTPFQRFVSSKNNNNTYLQKNNRSMQIISADKLAANYIRSFENLSKAEETLKKIDRIMNLDPVAQITGNEFQKDNIPLTDKVAAYYQNKYNGKIENPELGEIILDKKGIKDSLAHGIGKVKSAAFMIVPDVIKNGTIIDFQKNWKNRGYDTVVLAAPVIINNTDYIAEVIIKQRSKDQKFYLHEVEVKEKLKLEFQDPQLRGSNRASRLIISQLYQKAKEKFKSAAKNNRSMQIISADELKAKLNPDKPVYFIPVTNYENSDKRNKIPDFYAEYLEENLGGSVIDSVLKISGNANTGSKQRDRLINPHEYLGEIPDKNGQYVIVDDMYTSGNTIMPLIELVQKQGGTVAAVTALAHSQYSGNIKLRAETLENIIKKANIKDKELIKILSRATQAEGNIINDYVRRKNNPTESDVKSYISPEKEGTSGKSEESQGTPQGTQQSDQITPSEKSSKNTSNTTFQLAEDTENWNKQLDDFINGDLLQRRNAKVLSVTPDILQLFNANNLPIRIHPKILNKIVNEKHDITIEQLRRIIDQLYNPTAVFDSNPNEMRMPGEALAIFTDMLDTKSKPIMIGLYLDKKEGTFDINVIGSIYGKKDFGSLEDWYNLGLLRYINTEKVFKWPSSARRRLPGDSTLKNSKDILTQNSDIVKPILEDYRTQKTEADRQNQSFQLQTLPEMAKQYIQHYDQVRSLEKVFNKYGADWYIEQAHNIKQQILGRIEEITGREAPFNQGNILEDSYIRGTKAHLRYMEKDEYATDKFREKLRNGSVDDMKYMREELERLAKQIKAQSFEAGRLSKASKITKNEITAIQKELNKFIAAAPPEVRSNYRLQNRLTTLANIQGEKAQERYINKTLEVIDELITENNKWNQIREMYEDLRTFKSKKDSSGRLISRKLTAGVQQQITDIQTAMKMGAEKVDTEINKMMSVLEGSKDNPGREWNDDELRQFLIFDTFGNIINKTAKEVEQAHDELNSLLEKGVMQRELLENQFREKMREFQKKTIDIITAEKGLLTGKAAEKQRLKHKSYWWNVMKAPEYAVQAGYSFEYLMDALSRNDISSKHLESWLNKYFAREVHKATQTEEAGRRIRQQEHIAAIARIFGITPGKKNQIRKVDVIKFENKLKDFTKRVESPVKKWAHDWGDEKPVNFNYNQALIFRDQLRLGKGKIEYTDINGQIVKGNLFENVQNLEEISKQVAGFIDEFEAAELAGNPHKESISVYVLKDKGNYENIKMSQDEAVQYYLMMQQPDIELNMRIHGWDSNSFKALEDFLTPESKKYAQWLQETYDKQYDLMNKIYKKLFFVDMPKVKNYARAVFRVNKSGNESTDTAADIMSGGKIAGSAFATANPKTIVQRVAHRRELEQVSAIQTYLRSIYESEHFINFGEISKELRGVFKNEQVRNAIDQEFGKTKLKFVNNQVDTIISGGVSQNSLDKISNVIRGMTTQLVLSYKLVNLFKQITSLPAYTFDMPMGNFLKEVAVFWNHPVKNTKQFLVTDFFKNRWEAGYSQDLRNALHRAEGKPKNYFRSLLDFGMLPTKVGDIMPIIIGYNAVYNWKKAEYVKNGLSNEQAHREASIDAEMASERSQQAGAPKDLGYIQSVGGTALLFQMFLTSPRQYLNAVYSSIDSAVAGRPGAKKTALKKTITAWIVLSVLFQTASDLFKSVFDDDYEWDWRNYGVAMTMGPLNGIPVIGNMINYAARKAYGLYAGSPEFVAATNELYAGAVKGIEDLAKGDHDKVLKDITKNTGAGDTFKYTIYPLIKD